MPSGFVPLAALASADVGTDSDWQRRRPERSSGKTPWLAVPNAGTSHVLDPSTGLKVAQRADRVKAVMIPGTYTYRIHTISCRINMNELIDAILSVHERNFGDCKRELISELVAYYWIQPNEETAAFLELLSAISEHRALSLTLSCDTSSISGILLVLRSDFGWDIDDPGEMCFVKFPFDRMQLVLDRTGAGTGASTSPSNG
jgi:hypothetical protein